jgi:hypothetical protein
MPRDGAEDRHLSAHLPLAYFERMKALAQESGARGQIKRWLAHPRAVISTRA